MSTLILEHQHLIEIYASHFTPLHSSWVSNTSYQVLLGGSVQKNASKFIEIKNVQQIMTPA